MNQSFLKNTSCILLLALFIQICNSSAFSQHQNRLKIFDPDQEALHETIPYKVDNTQKKYFPGLFRQIGMSCNQASSIGYVFTYEINALRNLAADSPENKYPHLFPINFLNQGDGSLGVSYFDSWEIVRRNGVPNLADFGPDVQYIYYWMSGYDKYYRGMSNRIENDYSIFLGNPEGLNILKHWLYNHCGESENGGLASFQISSGEMSFSVLNEHTEEGGARIAMHFGPKVGHAMTFVGYNDSVRYDFNNDLQYTNNIDITGDGIVDMRDWEIGALQFVNSWGDHPRSFIPYRLLAFTPDEGGIWNRSVQIIKPKANYHPELTMKIELEHDKRNQLKVFAGVSSIDKDSPESFFEFPILNNQGGPYPMRGNFEEEGAKFIEVGIDLTEMKALFGSQDKLKVYLLIDEDDEEGTGHGNLLNFSVIDYKNGEKEYPYGAVPDSINNNSLNAFAVEIDNHFMPFDITTERILIEDSLTVHEELLLSENGDAPVHWSLANEYEEEFTQADFPQTDTVELFPNGNSKPYQNILLDFNFPFYGINHDMVRIYANGVLTFNNDYQLWPYAVNKDLFTTMRKGLFPAGKRLEYYPNLGDAVYCTSDTTFRVVWDCTYESDSMPQDVKLALELHPDGTIDFFYHLENNDFGNFDWYSGFSFGDGIHYFESAITHSDLIFDNQRVRFRPKNLPEGVELSEDGFLRIDPRLISDLDYITVFSQDNRNFKASKTISLMTEEKDMVFEISQNYPNPFSRYSAVEYTCYKKAYIKLGIYDSRGLLIGYLVNEVKEPGTYKAQIDQMIKEKYGMHPGIYYLRMEAEGQIETIKTILCKN